MSRISGPGLAGALAELAGSATGLLADCLVRLRGHRPVQGKPDSAAGSLARETAEGLRFVWRDPYLRAQMLFGGASNFTLTGVDALIVVFLVRNAGLGAAAVGLVMATFGIGGVLGTVIARPLARRLGTARTMTVCTIGGLPFALLLPLGHSGPRLAFVIATNLVVTAALVASSIIGASFRQAYVPAAMLGRVSSCVMTVSYSTLPAGAILAGTLATEIGTRSAMWVLTAGIALSGLVFLTTPMCRLRELPTRPVRSSLTPMAVSPLLDRGSEPKPALALGAYACDYRVVAVPADSDVIDLGVQADPLLASIPGCRRLQGVLRVASGKFGRISLTCGYVRPAEVRWLRLPAGEVALPPAITWTFSRVEAWKARHVPLGPAAYGGQSRSLPGSPGPLRSGTGVGRPSECQSWR